MNLPASAPSINAVIEAEAEVLHRADGNRVVAVGVGEHDWLFLQRSDGEDGGLGLVDDGRAEFVAEYAGVGERESGASHFIGRQLLACGLGLRGR